MKVTEEGYLFESTGRISLAHGTSDIGISGNEDGYDVVQGYDQTWYFEEHEGYDYFQQLFFTKEEKAELADHMIDLWTKFKNSG